MEIILILLFLIFLIVGIGISVAGRFRQKKKIEKFTEHFSKIERKRELIQALNDYKKTSSPTDYLVEIEERYGDVKRTYMKELSEKIVFGRNFSQSQICIYDKEASPVQFALLLNNDVPVIRSMSRDRDTVVRLKNKKGRSGSSRVKLGFNDELRLYTGDEIEIGGKKFLFTVWNRKTGIR